MARRWLCFSLGCPGATRGVAGPRDRICKKTSKRDVSNEIPRAATPSRRHPNRAPLAPRETRPFTSISRGHSSRETRACLFRIGLNDFPLRTDT